ncbi:MAG: hypothetical protein AAGJ83_14075, partial [Planctomycetota bacterium]
FGEHFAAHARRWPRSGVLSWVGYLAARLHKATRGNDGRDFYLPKNMANLFAYVPKFACCVCLRMAHVC